MNGAIFFPNGAFEFARLQANGKRSLADRFRGCMIQNCQLANKMVEGRSSIVDAITKNQRKHWVDSYSLFERYDQLLPIRFILIPRGYFVFVLRQT